MLVSPDQVEEAMAMNPLHIQEVLGKKRMLFECGDRERIGELGELHVPSVAAVGHRRATAVA